MLTVEKKFSQTVAIVIPKEFGPVISATAPAYELRMAPWEARELAHQLIRIAAMCDDERP